MKACFFRAFGGPEVLEYAELPDPAPAPGEVLVDIHAASVNAADWKMRKGDYAAMKDFPHVPGRDFSGVVAALGDGAGDFKVGEAVFGVCEVPREGAYAEKIAIRQAIVARKPASLTHSQCAAVALAGLTALVSLEDTLKLRKGETILIQGGAGGVAGFAIALARHLGARVITTASAANHDYVRALGAHEVIDYRSHDFTRLVSGCDAVFDTVGGEVTAKSFAVLRPGGRLASVAAGASAPVAPRADVVSLRPKVERDRPHLDRVAALVADGIVPLPGIVEYPLAKAADAQRVSEARHLRGKLVLRVR
ncbi:MAG TPA: NADP-dependent oxidoreductase [Burkholderiales bacterium]|jgi:NADPH:quinone reductase-like Zn-dependent oxidoreductase|nr:NADP-dependent oxidoreductase [Burkholderiales bacterium]